MSGVILIVDDEESMRKFFTLTLKREGYETLTASSVAEGVAVIREKEYDLVLSDIKLGDGQGLEVLAASQEKDPEIPVIMMTAYASPETAVEAMKLGAVDYLTKPFNIDEVRVVVRNNIRTRKIINENRKLKDQLKQIQRPDLIFKAPIMRRLMDVLGRVAKMDTTILAMGESGTGKDLIMKTLHEMSSRSEGAFVSVNCGALPESLLESELFGYEKGAFTGAEQRRIGLFESAKGGTIFLDEIGEIPLKMQVKLLRVLQERSIRRVGGTEEIPVDFRLLAATNRDLETEVRQGNFREDLYYRINVVPIRVPPLRERREDIPILVSHFVEKFSRLCGEDLKQVSGDALKALEHYRWPGNVRELENTLERVVVLTPGSLIAKSDLPSQIVRGANRQSGQEINLPAEGMDLEAYLEDLRFQFMKKSMDMTDSIQTKSSELLGMTFRSFRYYLTKGKELGYFPEEPKKDLDPGLIGDDCKQRAASDDK